MTQRPDLNQLSADQLRALARELIESLASRDQALRQRDKQLSQQDRELLNSKTLIEKLTHELALLKRHKFARRSEQLDAVQGRLTWSTILLHPVKLLFSFPVISAQSH
jgi:hypothetical protein